MFENFQNTEKPRTAMQLLADHFFLSYPATLFLGHRIILRVGIFNSTRLRLASRPYASVYQILITGSPRSKSMAFYFSQPFVQYDICHTRSSAKISIPIIQISIDWFLFKKAVKHVSTTQHSIDNHNISSATPNQLQEI
jgi:hypothetical protein